MVSLRGDLGSAWTTVSFKPTLSEPEAISRAPGRSKIARAFGLPGQVSRVELRAKRLGGRMVPGAVGVREGGARPDHWWRQQLSNLYGLFVISMLMFEAREADAILRLAATSAPALSDCEVVASYLVIHGVLTSRPDTKSPDAQIAAQVGSLSGNTGPIVLADGAWGWCFALCGQVGLNGCLVVRAAKPPPREEFFLLEALGQQTGRALAAAWVYRRETEQAVELQQLNTALSATVARLEGQTNVHEVLSSVSATGAGESGIADALHRLTSLPIAIEDRFGNLRAWSGPGRPDPVSEAGRPRASGHAPAGVGGPAPHTSAGPGDLAGQAEKRSARRARAR